MKKEHFRQLRIRLALFVSLFLFVIFTLSGCGGSKDAEETEAMKDNEDTSGTEEWVYVPEFFSMEGEYIDFDGAKVAGNNLCYLSFAWDEEIQYYTQVINTMSLQDGTAASFPLAWPDGPQAQAMVNYAFGNDGCLYGIAQTFPGDSEAPGILLCKFQPEGNQEFSQDITEQPRENPEEGIRISAVEIDGQNRIYIAGNSEVWLYDGKGQYKGNISLEKISHEKVSPGNGASGQQASEQSSYANLRIDGLYCDGNGNMYVSYGENGFSAYGYTLAEIDFESQKITAVCTDFLSVNDLSPDPGKSFLIQDQAYVRTYDPAAQDQGEILFGWMDCDIAGSSVLNFGQTADGHIAAVLEGQNGSGEIALLKKVRSDQAVQKETLVLGVLTGGYNYEPAVVRFNRSNERYRIVLKEYYNYEEDGSITLEDALAKLYAEIASDHCPDLLEVSGLNLTQLAAKDVFQDLRSCLEKSSAFEPGDFVEEILDAYTIEGTLVTIPYAVFLETVMGHEGQTGQPDEWTPEAVIALAEANPDAELFDGADRDDMMDFLMEYGEEIFVDWESGKCSFDSEQFKSLLQFVKSFPETVEYNPDRLSTPARIQNGEVLLKQVDLYNFDSIQIDLEAFGSDAVCIGYPTMDGGKNAMTAIFSYAITSKSKHKEGAWAFIESILREENGSNGMGFPSVKQRLEDKLEEAVNVKYALDENGEIYLDENGDPIILGNTSIVQYSDGWSYTYHTPTREEAELILSLLANARPIFLNNENEIRTIIAEEAVSFYNGQKTVDEVAEIIQNRVSLYVNENR